jgi:hypothetical protein
MQWTRYAEIIALLAALGVGVTKTSCVASAFPVVAPCSSSALSVPYSGPLRVTSVDSFGCVGTWAYLWATVGTGVRAIGVTEVLHYDTTTASWRNASRLTYCNHKLLPTYVEFWGCNSN